MILSQVELQFQDAVSGDTVTAYLGNAGGGIALSIFSVNGGEFEGCLTPESGRQLAEALLKRSAGAVDMESQGS